MRFLLIFSFVILTYIPSLAQANQGVAMHGAPKYGSNFKHFDYVNPGAPKGGHLALASVGTFDSLNPFITKGVAPSSISMVYQTLMVASADEAFSKYPNIANQMIMANDNSGVTFTINPAAQWHDGNPITAHDVVWTFQTLLEKGQPFYSAYYSDVETVKVSDNKTVIFTFKTTENKELPLILASLPVLPKHFWNKKDNDFSATSLTPPLGSGPYRVSTVEAGKKLMFERVANWWAADLPVNKGRYNFDTITVDFYRDSTVAVEALFAGNYDLREEHIAKSWAKNYNNDVVKSGRIIKAEISNQKPAGMQAFMMNIRRPVFQDRAVRKALQLVFDFEWSNKQFAFGAYKRTNSFFENSELASKGVPMGRELEILSQFKDQLPPELLTTPYTNPTTDGTGNNRDYLRRAMKILDEAGYVLGSDKIRVHKQTGQRLSFEIVDNQPEFDRWILPMIKNLKRIGVEANFRVVDTAQYVERLTNFDYDMTVHGMAQSQSPGNEQIEFWHSSKADVVGSRNYIGIKNPVIDRLIDMVVNAPDRDELIYRTRALDRVLLWGYYVIPQWHINKWRVAHWDKFGRPDTQAPYALGAIDTWWIKPATK